MDVQYYDMLESDESPTGDDIRFFMPGQRYWYDMEGIEDARVLQEQEDQAQTLVVTTMSLRPTQVGPLLLSMLEQYQGVSVGPDNAWITTSEHCIGWTAVHLEPWDEGTCIWFTYKFGHDIIEAFVESVAIELQKRDHPSAEANE